MKNIKTLDISFNDLADVTEESKKVFADMVQNAVLKTNESCLFLIRVNGNFDNLQFCEIARSLIECVGEHDNIVYIPNNIVSVEKIEIEVVRDDKEQ